MDREIIKGQRIAKLRTARKYFTCAQCKSLLSPGEQYYAVVLQNSGFISVKYPDRVHPKCMDAYWRQKDEMDRERERGIEAVRLAHHK